jgi:hypothetical protein
MAVAPFQLLTDEVRLQLLLFCDQACTSFAVFFACGPADASSAPVLVRCLAAWPALQLHVLACTAGGAAGVSGACGHLCASTPSSGGLRDGIMQAHPLTLLLVLMIPACNALQVALLVYLAHVGSFVPAQRAVVGLRDRIQTRLPCCLSISPLYTLPAMHSAGCAAGVPGTCGQLCASAAGSGGAA